MRAEIIRSSIPRVPKAKIGWWYKVDDSRQVANVDIHLDGVGLYFKYRHLCRSFNSY